MNKITIELSHVEETFNYGELFTVELSKDGSSATVYLPSHDVAVTFVNNDSVKQAKYIICDTLGITMEELNTVKKEKPVLGRWLIWEYAMKKRDYTLVKAGQLFKRRNGNPYAHSTILWALRELNNPRLLQWQKDVINEFRKKIDELNK